VVSADALRTSLLIAISGLAGLMPKLSVRGRASAASIARIQRNGA